MLDCSPRGRNTSSPAQVPGSNVKPWTESTLMQRHSVHFMGSRMRKRLCATSMAARPKQGVATK
ncbi:Hypothetical protein AA314_01289 [Archangium gephyra]|uniref:Uncharacterized protein n=1 Tax=Archangium gephyra TaxID=48 RepID=A0AAC8Q297_9BACT|nr:hypothetical protein [Archangium gephyra]AKI99662.1 Hypothetical protein AA314_01289 [Archangium gephyra]